MLSKHALAEQGGCHAAKAQRVPRLFRPRADLHELERPLPFPSPRLIGTESEAVTFWTAFGTHLPAERERRVSHAPRRRAIGFPLTTTRYGAFVACARD